MILASLFSLSILLGPGAPRPFYGGEVAVLYGEKPPRFDPRTIDSLVELNTHQLIFEPLYRRTAEGEVAPVLAAAPPEVDGSIIKIRLLPQATFHSGEPVTATLVVKSLLGLLAPGRASAHVLLPVRGARSRLLAGPKGTAEMGAIGIKSGTEDKIFFELEAPYPAFLRLLAAPEAGIVSEGSGSGPFYLSDQKLGTSAASPSLVSFPMHHRGRPYLDRIRFDPSPPSSATRARALPEPVYFALQVPLLTRPTDEALVFEPPSASIPTESWTLVVGKRGALFGRPGIADRVSRALNRSLLARRVLRGAEPVDHFFLGAPGPGIAAPSPPQPPPQPAGRPPSTLLIAPRSAIDRAVAERVQLDLLHAGVASVISIVSAEELTDRRRSGEFDLLLDALFLPGPDPRDAFDHLHRLLAITCHYDRVDLLPPDLFLLFGSASIERKHEILSALDRQLFESGLVPLTAQKLSFFGKTGLVSARFFAVGALDLEDAQLAGKSVGRPAGDL